MELEGTIKLVMDEEKYPSGFYKREFVITTNEQYPQDIKFETFKEKTEMLNGINSGEKVKVFFDIRGREYSGKYYNNLVCWKLERSAAVASASAGPSQNAVPMSESPFGGNMPDLDGGDDLPF